MNRSGVVGLAGAAATAARGMRSPPLERGGAVEIPPKSGDPLAAQAVPGDDTGHQIPGGPVAAHQVAAEDLPRALQQAFRQFGPAWLRWLRAHVGEFGLSPARQHLLGHLAAADGPLIMRELTSALGTTPRAVTGLVDALEAQGLVRRGSHPTDRRATLVSLAQAGLDLVRGQRSCGVASAASIFAVLSERDQRDLLRILGRLTQALTQTEPGRNPNNPAPQDG